VCLERGLIEGCVVHVVRELREHERLLLRHNAPRVLDHRGAAHKLDVQQSLVKRQRLLGRQGVARDPQQQMQ
jgi:hypothetical protein